VPGSGSSDLLFRACLRWLTPGSRVLLPDPTYGEYAHVLDNVVHCRVDRFRLRRAAGFAFDLTELARCLQRGYDFVALVNPNNPTGRHVPRSELAPVLAAAPRRTRFWIDEAYIDYVGPDESLERFAAASPNVVVCKSMSKAYALSGARAAYLCGPESIVHDLRSITPPWVIGLPAQIAGVLALRDPGYYAARIAQTRRLRDALANDLGALGIDVTPGAANFLLCRRNGSAAELLAACRERGLFLRDVSSMMSHPHRGMFRVAVKDHETNARIIDILRAVLGTGFAQE
jgi:histidinol-phosphate/aromatic aminotransferase/cobyric acid decarboxylase-like protein